MTQETFANSTTWTCPVGVTFVDVECWGAGGGGGVRAGAVEGGGGGGAYARNYGFSVTPGVAYTVNVPAGGAPDSTGDDTWFSSTSGVLAECGFKGSTAAGNGGSFGTEAASVGQIKFQGGASGTAVTVGTGGGSAAGLYQRGVSVGSNVAVGGVAPLGGGDGGAGGSTATPTGSTGLIPGGGGGGGGATSNSASGARGQVRLTYFTNRRVLADKVPTVVDVGTASTASADWTSSTNVTASDDAYATCTLSSTNEISEQLVARNFGFAIPDSATINGVLATIQRKASSTTGKPHDLSIKLHGDGPIGDDYASTLVIWPTVDLSIPYGGPDDDWGVLGLTPAFINNSDFGLAIRVASTGLGAGTLTMSVDAVTMTVYYTVAAPSQIGRGEPIAESMQHSGNPVGYRLSRVP